MFCKILTLIALQATEGEVKGTVVSLNNAISQITLSQKTLTSEIREEQKSITRQDREFQT